MQTCETRPFSSLAPEPSTLEWSDPIPPAPLTALHVETPPIQGTIYTPSVELEMMNPAPPRMMTQELPEFTKHHHRGPTERLDPELFGIDVSGTAPSRKTVDLTPEEMQRNMDRFAKLPGPGHESQHLRAADSGKFVYAPADSGQRSKHAAIRKPKLCNDSQIVWKSIAGVMLTIVAIFLVLALT